MGGYNWILSGLKINFEWKLNGYEWKSNVNKIQYTRENESILNGLSNNLIQWRLKMFQCSSFNIQCTRYSYDIIRKISARCLHYSWVLHLILSIKYSFDHFICWFVRKKPRKYFSADRAWDFSILARALMFAVKWNYNDKMGAETRERKEKKVEEREEVGEKRSRSRSHFIYWPNVL